MSIIDNISDEDRKSIEKLVSEYGDNNEFETSMFSNSKTGSEFLTTEKFMNLNSILDKVTRKYQEPQKQVSLDVIMGIRDEKDSIPSTLTNYRISIEGIDTINDYMKMLNTHKNTLIFSALCSFSQDKDNKNVKLIKKTKYVSKYVTIPNYFMRVKLDKEEEDIKKEEIRKLGKINKNFGEDEYDIIFRYKDRTSYFIKNEKNIFRIDLTKVKTAHNINNLESSNYEYDIEIECEIKDKKNILLELFKKCEYIIKSIQGSNFIVSKLTSDAILTSYRQILNVSSEMSNLYGRQPISLEIKDLSKLQNKYSVTDKADGERNFMIVFEGYCYLISTNLVVKNTGIKVNDNLNGTIVDGEYIFVQKYNKYLYMAFDCLFIGQKDMRQESKFLERLNEIDKNLTQEINKTKFDYCKNNNKVKDVENILKNHTSNLELFFDDINESLKTSKNKTLFRRKYFMACEGIIDNEIFKYMDLFWKNYMLNNKITYPYELDGLILQPIEQKYIVEQSQSKYPDYKSKPEDFNSVDCYSMIEKNPITNENQLIFDNSVDGTIKNKPYIMINLYVGSVSRNRQEKPVEFMVKGRPAVAYIYVDENNIARSLDGKVISDNTVIEYIYYTKEEIKEEFRWKPMRTRHDKTDSVIKYKRKYGNNEYVAESVMRSILNPVLMSEIKELADDNLYEKTFEKINLRKDIVKDTQRDRATNVYYQKKSGLVKDMGAFHNYVKSSLLWTYCQALYTRRQLRILDIGTGRGGDVEKFYYVAAKEVVCIDPDIESLINSSERSALSTYMRMKARKDNVPPMYFIHGDAGLLFKYEDQVKFTGSLNKKNKLYFDKYLNWEQPKMFDRVNSSFAIHYLLKSQETWNNFQDNLNNFLREGGYLMFETFDGDIVKKKLTENDGRYTEYYTENGERKVFFDIVQKFDDKDKNKVGNTIDVHMEWIFDEDVYVPEYLVYKDFIVDSLNKNCDMELVDTVLFQDFFESNEQFLKMGSQFDYGQRRKFFKSVYNFYEPTELNQKCYGYSFLNRIYIFRKREHNLKENKQKYYSQEISKSTPRLLSKNKKRYDNKPNNEKKGKYIKSIKKGK